jgi:hypothetical protein
LLDVFNVFITLLGIVLGFAGVALTFATFFAPKHIQRLALRNSRQWMDVPPQKEGNAAYRHKLLSGFTIEVDFSNPICDGNFFEFWMKALYRPDPRASSYYAVLSLNGLPVDRFLFLQYDGGRNFIPVPLQTPTANRNYVFFSSDQHKVADIVGYNYWNRPFHEVADSITGSQFNPFFHTLPDRSWEDLELRIESFKSKISDKY